MILDYFLKVEKKTSEMGIIAEKSIEFREFDIDEGFVKGRVLFIDGSVLELFEYIKGEDRIKYRFHYMDKKGALTFRYDNAPHHKNSTFPHHKHIPEKITESKSPELLDVFDEIEMLLFKYIKSGNI
ncbi:MAG: DUF6516 family protein [Methanothrix sp.]|nr:DUF6516 family protein [Methanothrix sp.]